MATATPAASTTATSTSPAAPTSLPSIHQTLTRRDDIGWHPAVPSGHTEYSWGRMSRRAAVQTHQTVDHKASKQPKPKSQQQAASATAPKVGTKLQDTNQSSPKQKKATAKVATNDAAAIVTHYPPEFPRKLAPTPVRPKHHQRNILITSALPYVNNVPHLGNLIGCVLSADVYARYCRLRGYQTLYMCGTDEYGTATETKAQEMNMTPQQICDLYYGIHKDIYEYFGIQFDHFGRTTTKEQTEITQHIFNKLDQNGYITDGQVEQLFCEKDQRFLADRFVEGTCHHEDCGYNDARGDQCDKCGRLIDAALLINPRCKICGQKPVIRTSQHLFLRLDKLVPRHKEWFDKHARGKWTDNSIQITEQWMHKGLEQRCITRDLKWGTPLPASKQGYENKVFYVWFDACIGYVSITATHTKEWREWWYNSPDTNVELVQFMGKDNVPFHAVMFPCSQIGTNEQWTTVSKLSTTEFLNYEGGKFSKSRNVGVFGDDVKNTNIAVEVWRYYLLSNRPETQDSMFLWNDFALKNNSELLNNLGNLCNRTLKFVASSYDSTIPAANKLTNEEHELFAEVNSYVDRYIAAMEKIAIRDALRVAMELSARCNKYVQDNKAWELFKSDRAHADTVINITVHLIGLVALVLESHIPSFAEKVYQQLNYRFADTALATGSPTEPNTIAPYKFEPTYLPANHKIGTPFIIFRRIEDSEIDALRTKFNEKTDLPSLPLDIRVGYITDVQPHPKMDNLLVLTIDTGDSSTRTVVAGGLKKTYTEPQTQLVGKAVAVLVNCKPVSFKGVESHGMLLLGVKGTTNIGLLTPDAQTLANLTVPIKIKAGTPIVAKGAKLTIKDTPIDPKAEFKTLPLSISDVGHAQFANLPWIVKDLEFDLPIAIDGFPVEQGTARGWKIQ